MPANPALDAAVDPTIGVYREAWERIVAEQEALVNDPTKAVRRRRLREMQGRIESILDELDGNASRNALAVVRDSYTLGATSTRAVSEFAWSGIHREAVEQMATDMFEDLLKATDGVRDSTKALVRSIGRDRALRSVIDGDTATQAARAMRAKLETNGVFSVVYRDGSRHGLAEYTQVAMRTKTAVAYNTGTLNAHPEVRYWEIFDGPFCGLTFHDDPTTASGMIVERGIAEQFPISHPNCRRAFGPRPDVGSAATIKELAKDPNTVKSGQVTQGQRAAQIEQDRERRAQSRRQRLGRERRARRSVR